MPKDLGGVSLTHVLGMRHIDLVSAMDPAVTCELAPAPLGYGSGANRKQCLRQSSSDEKNERMLLYALFVT